MTVEANIGIGPNDTGPGFMLAAHVRLSGADAKTAKDVAHEAHMICPYSNATRNNIEVKLTVTPADGNTYDVI